MGLGFQHLALATAELWGCMIWLAGFNSLGVAWFGRHSLNPKPLNPISPKP